MSRKAQITMIVILGIVLLIVFFFLFSLKDRLDTDQESSVTKLLYEIESGLVKNQITDCVNKVGSDGLERLAANGGNLYDYDGGYIPLAALTEGEDYLRFSLGARQFRPAYGLRENLFCPSINYSTPGYPSQDTDLESLAAIYNADDECAFAHPGADYDGFLGEVTLPKMCSLVGDSSCHNFAKGPVLGRTMQRQLEDYLARKVPLCVNLSDFSEQFNAEIEQDGNLSAQVSIRDQDIQLYVEYPFRITFKGAQPISKLVKYQSVLKVRMGALYNYLYDVLSQDARDPFFSIKDHSLASSFWMPGFSLQKKEDPCTDCDLTFRYDDIVEVMDTESILNGKPLLFRAAVQDRRPILSFIPNTEYDINPSIPFTEPVRNSEIEIIAVDPDDGPLDFIFMGEGPAPGWRDGENLAVEMDDGTYLMVYFSALDVGNHLAGLMAIDSAGFFDYQPFMMRVEHSGRNRPGENMCRVDTCPLYESQDFCDRWCSIAVNFCISSDRCIDTGWPASAACSQCVERVLYADRPENHVACQQLTSEATCVAKMPDCFWVIEPTLPPPGNEGKCYSDHALDTVSPRAVIVR